MTMRIHGDKIEFPDGTEQFTASSGGDVVVEPAVAFKYNISTDQEVPSNSPTDVKWNVVDIDTDSGLNADGNYEVKKAGLYNFSANVQVLPAGIALDNLERATVLLHKNGDNANRIQSGVFSKANYLDRFGATVSGILNCEVGDIISIAVSGTEKAVGNLKLDLRGCSFSGHMVSSITEGEVKEKEAVVMSARLEATQSTVTPNTFVKINLTSLEDTSNSFDNTTHRFTPKVEGYYSVTGSVQAKGLEVIPHGKIVKNGNEASYDDDKDSYGLTYIGKQVGQERFSSPIVSKTHIIYFNGTTDYIELWGKSDNKTDIEGFKYNTSLSAHLITGQSSGGGTGGGSYTPEPMVWKAYTIGDDPVTQRKAGFKFTNDNEVPIFLNLYIQNVNASWYQLWVDDGFYGSIGGENLTTKVFNYVTTTIPAGSTYEIRAEGANADDGRLINWLEARMPMAVGAGKPVAFRGELSAIQEGITSTTWTKVNLDTASVDTDNAFIDGKFKPSVAGWYQVNGSVNQACEPVSIRTSSSIYKNTKRVADGSYASSATTNSHLSNVSDIVYLDPENKWTDDDGNEQVGDYLELYALVNSTGTCAIYGGKYHTFLSAVLISGGSASGGDSIWTEEDGSVLYSAEDRARILLSETNSDRGVNVGSWNNKKYLEGTGDGDFIISHNSDSDNLILKTGGAAKSSDAMKISSNGNINMPRISTTASPPNMHYSATGWLYKSTATMYTTEEVDDKLAIKDKLIEKLSARLDKLEKKLK